MKYTVFIIFVSSFLISSSNALLSCYSCIGCNEPFTSNALYGVTCQSTEFFCYKFSGSPSSYTSVAKGCMASCINGNYQQANVNGTLACCTSNYCNNTPRLIQTPYFSVLFLISATSLFMNKIIY